MTKPSVLVSGGAGYIGSHAVLALREAGWTVAVVDNLSTGTRDAVPSDVPFFEGDISDHALIATVLRGQRIGAIMHFAGSIIVPESVERPLKYYGNNTVASHQLINACVEAGIKHILFSSTAAVYGAPDKTAVQEDDPTIPINPYGLSKLMTEWMLRDASAAHPFNYGALRYFNVAGADPRGRSGQRAEGSTHLIKVAVEAAVGKRDCVRVFGTDYDTPDGTCIRDYIHVSDLAAAHVAALERLFERPEDNLVLNCGYGRGLSVLEVLDAVDRANGTPIRRVMEGRRPGDPPKLISKNTRILETLDWKPAYTGIDQIVGDALAWEKALQEKRAVAIR
jgi:UDP-glucose 4-epimerase